jgi:hypothetical protein
VLGTASRGAAVHVGSRHIRPVLVLDHLDAHGQVIGRHPEQGRSLIPSSQSLPGSPASDCCSLGWLVFRSYSLLPVSNKMLLKRAKMREKAA